MQIQLQHISYTTGAVSLAAASTNASCERIFLFLTNRSIVRASCATHVKHPIHDVLCDKVTHSGL